MDCRFANTTLYSYPVMDDAAPGFDPAFRRRRALACAAGGFLAAGAVCLLALRSLMSLLCIPVLVVALGFLLYGRLSARVNQSAFRARILQSAPSRKIEYAFYDEHFTTRAAGEERAHEYTALTRWYRGSRTITLCTEGELFLLDRDEFTRGSADNFCAFLSERV